MFHISLNPIASSTLCSTYVKVGNGLNNFVYIKWCNHPFCSLKNDNVHILRIFFSNDFNSTSWLSNLCTTLFAILILQWIVTMSFIYWFLSVYKKIDTSLKKSFQRLQVFIRKLSIWNEKWKNYEPQIWKRLIILKF